MIATVWAESIPYWATSSNTVILTLTPGDQVWLVLLKRAPYVHGYMYTSFSGYSLFAADNTKERYTKDEEIDHDILNNEIMPNNSSTIDQG